MIKDFFLISLKNLKRRGLRSWLTMLGIFIGIAAVVALISLGQGLQGAINAQFEQLGKDKIVIQTKTMGPPGSTTSRNLMLTTKDLDTIRNVMGVDKAEGLLIKNGPLEFKTELKITFVVGLPYAKDRLGGSDLFQIIQGSDIKEGDKFKAIIGNNLAFSDFFKKQIKVGDTIKIENVEFKVTGITKKTGNPFDDNAVFIPKEILKEMLNTGDEESEIIAKTQAGFDPATVAKDIERKLRKERGEKEDQETFTVQTSDQLLQSFSTIFGIVQAVLVGIAAISLLVGGVGIMNTMYTSVLERTKEIGIMKAIGAKNSDILTLFLFESGLLGTFGGLIGIAIGIGLAKGAQYITSAALGSDLLQASLSPLIIFGALAFSFVIGSLSGILPALQASHLKPVDALRYE